MWLRVVLYLPFLILVGCQQPPDFPDTPKIKFLSLEETDANLLTLAFEFEDGNANLGLGANQTNEPFHEYNYVTIDGDTLPPSRLDENDIVIDSAKNLFFSNIILSTYLKVNGDFQKAFYGIDLTNGDTIFRPDLRFPSVTQKVNGQPVSGTIEVDINTQFFIWQSTDTLRFEFYIFDRDLQRSNTVASTPFSI